MAGPCAILFQTLLLLVWFGQSCTLLSSIPVTSAFIRTRTEITNSENEAMGMGKVLQIGVSAARLHFLGRAEVMRQRTRKQVLQMSVSAVRFIFLGVPKK